VQGNRERVFGRQIVGKRKLSELLSRKKEKDSDEENEKLFRNSTGGGQTMTTKLGYFLGKKGNKNSSFGHG